MNVELKARLDDEWNARPTAGPSIQGARLGYANGRDVVFSVGPDGTRHLLVALESENVASRRWEGLVISNLELGELGQPIRSWVDFHCTESGYDRVFRALCRDLLDALSDPARAFETSIDTTLRDWSKFWGHASELTREAEIGLLGELLFLRDWLIPIHGSRAIELWAGPDGARHDFVSETISVEVKTTSSYKEAPSHAIASLEQLEDPQSGALYLASIQIIEDPLGSLELAQLIEEIVALLDSGGIGAFDTKLLRAGYTSTDSPRHRWFAVSTSLYSVNEGFPRLTRAALSSVDPNAISSVSYRIEMSACAPWLRETQPSFGSVVASMT